ncbi:hypothetical protein AVEN_91365-1, partial [Araneus ventricosus]
VVTNRMSVCVYFQSPQRLQYPLNNMCLISNSRSVSCSQKWTKNKSCFYYSKKGCVCTGTAAVRHRKRRESDVKECAGVERKRKKKRGFQMSENAHPIPVD